MYCKCTYKRNRWLTCHWRSNCTRLCNSTWTCKCVYMFETWFCTCQNKLFDMWQKMNFNMSVCPLFCAVRICQCVHMQIRHVIANVNTNVNVNVHVNANINVNLNLNVNVNVIWNVHVNVHVKVNVDVYACVHVCLCLSVLCVGMSVKKHVYVSANWYLSVHVNVKAYAYVYICACVCKFMCARTSPSI